MPSARPNRPITLLDGALGTALRDRGAPVGSWDAAAWSATTVAETPELVRALHEDYVRAGCDVITVNNYACVPRLLERVGWPERTQELTERALELAIDARRRAGPVRIAVSLPPLSTTYRVDLVPDDDELQATYGAIVACTKRRADLYLAETLSSLREATAALNAGRRSGLPVWISFCSAGPAGHLLSGEPLALVGRWARLHRPDVLLLNCGSVRATVAGLEALGAVYGGMLGGYPNPHHDVLEPPGTPPGPEHQLDPEAFAAAGLRLADAGAGVVGGCCHTEPAHLRALALLFKTGAHRDDVRAAPRVG